jgi:hypothetical protein
VAVDDADNVLKYNIKSLANFCCEVTVSHLAISSDLKIITSTNHVANINKSSKKWLTSFNIISNSNAVLDLDVKQGEKLKKFKRKKRHKVGKGRTEERQEMLYGEGMELDRCSEKQLENKEYQVDGFDSDSSSSHDESLLNELITESNTSQQEQKNETNTSSVLSNLSTIAHDPLILEDAFDVYDRKKQLEIEGIDKRSQKIFGQDRHTFTNKGTDSSYDADSNIDKNCYNDTAENNVRETFPIANYNRNHWISGRAEASAYLRNKKRMKNLSETFQISPKRPASAPAAINTNIPKMNELNSRSMQIISKRDLPPFNIFPCQFCVQYFRGEGEKYDTWS